MPRKLDELYPEEEAERRVHNAQRRGATNGFTIPRTMVTATILIGRKMFIMYQLHRSRSSTLGSSDVGKARL
jgi:hypothetical protein